MPRKKYTKETIIQTLQNLAKSLNKNTLSKKEVNKILSTSTVCYHFGSLGKALEAAGLEKNITNQNPKGTKIISDDELFKSMREVEIKIGKDNLKPQQIKFKEMIISLGGLYFEIRNEGDIENTIKVLSGQIP